MKMETEIRMMLLQVQESKRFLEDHMNMVFSTAPIRSQPAANTLISDF